MARIQQLRQAVSDETIASLIEKYSLGASVVWERIFSDLEIPGTNPETGEPDTATIPVCKIYLGMPGHLLGPEYYIWWTLLLNAIPTLDNLESNIRSALETMRTRKDLQRRIVMRENGQQ